LQDELRRQTKLMAKALNVCGLMNVQFAIQDDVVYVLEVNPRASRTVPFVSKATGLQLAKIAARCMAGKSLCQPGRDARKSSRRISRSRKPFSRSSSSPASIPSSGRK
jgi:carbamoylphosphate synthase large subunit